MTLIRSYHLFVAGAVFMIVYGVIHPNHSRYFTAIVLLLVAALCARGVSSTFDTNSNRGEN